MAAPCTGRRYSYVIGNNLYVHITSRANSVTLLGSRGPLMQWPDWLQDVREAQEIRMTRWANEFFADKSTPTWQRLPHVRRELGADPQEVLDEVRAAVAEADANKKPFESIVFAGDGEPTLALEALVQVGEGLRGLLPLRLNTNGLGSLEHGRDIVPELRFFSGVSVLLNAPSGLEYGKAMKPRGGGLARTDPATAFAAAAAFVRRCVAMKVEVEVTAVEAPGRDLEAVRRLALDELGAGSFRARSYHPVPDVYAESGSLRDLAAKGDADGISRALASASPGSANVRDVVGNTPLIWAAERGHSVCVKLLLDHGVDVNARGLIGNSALHRAARRGHHEVATQLLEAGAQVSRYNSKMQTELHFAAHRHHCQVVKVLLEAKAHPGLPDRRGQMPRDDTEDEDIKAELTAALEAL